MNRFGGDVKKRFLIAFSAITSIVVLDQITKNMVSKYPMGVINNICDYFRIIHTKNTGAAFSFLAGSGDFVRIVFLIGLPVLLTGALVYYMYKKRSDAFTFYSLSLILSGAIGNIIDRIRFGAVVDFLDFYYKSYHYPAFNVADSFVTIGVILLLIQNFKYSKKA